MKKIATEKISDGLANALVCESMNSKQIGEQITEGISEQTSTQRFLATVGLSKRICQGSVNRTVNELGEFGE